MKSLTNLLSIVRCIFLLVIVAQAADAAKLKHRTTTTPYSEFGKRLQEYVSENPKKAQRGVIDVTCHPYNAKGDGRVDDTQALQNAIDDAYPNNFMVYLPANKTFLVSRQLKLLTCLESRRYGHQLIGAVSGKKAVIRLKDKSTIDKNILVYFQYNGGKQWTDACHYGATFRNIHIDMGNNPGATALSMSGAQHCAVEDVKIYGKAFKSGIKNLPGSGGGSVNVHVIGGDIGIHQDQHRPNPTVIGLVLEGQKEYGIKLDDTRGPLVITGFKITAPKRASRKYRAIYLNNTSKSVTKKGIVAHGAADLGLTDGSIDVSASKGVAISNGSQDLSLVNVYIKADKLIENGVTTAPYSCIAGNRRKWKNINQYMFSSKLDKSSVVIGGKALNNRGKHFELAKKLSRESPDKNLFRKHSYGQIPDFNDPNVIDITEYGATPATENAEDNDAIAIQKALDDVSDRASSHYGKTVLIPRGNFGLDNPIVVKKGTKLIGTAKNISTLYAMNPWANREGAIVSTVDDSDGNIVLSDFSIMGYPRMCYLLVQSGKTVVRDVVTESKLRYGWPENKEWKKNKRDQSYIEFSKNAGGKVYHLSTDHIMLKDRYRSGAPTTGYHLVSVKNTRNPLTFYQLSVEHHPHSPKFMVNNAENLTVFGLKFEGPAELMNIVSSKNVAVCGGSGNYHLDRETDRAIIVIENSENVVLRNLARKSKDKLFGKIVDDICKFWIIDSKTKVSGNYGVLWYE